MNCLPRSPSHRSVVAASRSPASAPASPRHVCQVTAGCAACRRHGRDFLRVSTTSVQVVAHYGRMNAVRLSGQACRSRAVCGEKSPTERHAIMLRQLPGRGHAASRLWKARRPLLRPLEVGGSHEAASHRDLVVHTWWSAFYGSGLACRSWSRLESVRPRLSATPSTSGAMLRLVAARQC